SILGEDLGGFRTIDTSAARFRIGVTFLLCERQPLIRFHVDSIAKGEHFAVVDELLVLRRVWVQILRHRLGRWFVNGCRIDLLDGVSGGSGRITGLRWLLDCRATRKSDEGKN